MSEPLKSKTPDTQLQEALDAVSSSGQVWQKGFAQYPTPPPIAERLTHKLLKNIPPHPKTAVDPQCGDGALLQFFPYNVAKYGFEISKDHMPQTSSILAVQGNCVKLAETLQDIKGHCHFDIAVANYPFGLKWKQSNGADIKSWEWTTKWCFDHANAGFFIGPVKDLEHLTKDARCFHSEVFPWPGAKVDVIAILWKRATPVDTGGYANQPKLNEAFNLLKKIQYEERKKLPPFNIWLNKASKVAGSLETLSTYLSTRQKIKKNLTPRDLIRLSKLDGETPQTLAVDINTRRLLKELIDSNAYLIEPAAREAITSAISQAKLAATPLLPVTDFERVAYAEEEDKLRCCMDWPKKNPIFKRGEWYKVTAHTYDFKEKIIRRKPHYNEKTGETSIIPHECVLSGKDRFLRVKSPLGSYDFMDKPAKNLAHQVPEHWLWRIFDKPAVPTLADTKPALHRSIKDRLDILQSFGGFQFYPGQYDYLSRVLMRDHALIAGAVGVGKTLFAASAYAVKEAKRCLIVCPKSSSYSKDNTAQWFEELEQFCPHLHIHSLFSMKDWDDLIEQYGAPENFPAGFYLTYYHAIASNNGAMETCPGGPDKPKMKDSDLLAMVGQTTESDGTDLVTTIGEQQNGIRCIARPSLATIIANRPKPIFDMMCLDEAHHLKSITSQRTNTLIRLSPPFRYAFTATPVANTAEDLFTLHGWLDVDDWYQGGLCNAAFPYRLEDLHLFIDHFLVTERDITAEAMATLAGKKRNVVRKAPVLSSPARLLKILKPTLAYIDKSQCNPDYTKPEIIDVRVPFSERQAKAYDYFMDISNVPMAKTTKDHRVRRGKQIAFLRSLCSDPATASCADLMEPNMRPLTNLTPKVIAILELTRDIIKTGEQVVIVNSRLGISDEIQCRLEQAGVTVSRIDSNSVNGHAEEANLFKRGHTQVMIMGIKCAMGHSFQQCRNLIIGSLEYDPASFTQAAGRVDRVNSPKGVKICCILHRDSIEEIMFDTVALKDDASRIILQGKRIPRNFKSLDMSEVLASSMLTWKDGSYVSDNQALEAWPKLKQQLSCH
jgi:SNF2 family DNA or RNA helicase/predicted RNA methylase